jgi:hypothetical protein
MSGTRNKPKSLYDLADELANRHLSSPGAIRRGVSNEPRIPKGSPHGGEWAAEAENSPSASARKPAATKRGTTIRITYPDGTVEIRSGGTRAWRNNNPGNIEAGPAANAAGAIGSDGRFAIFPDEASGETALETELERRSALTIDQAIAKRTPPDDKGNNTALTQKQIRDFSGLPGDAIIGPLSPAEKQRLYAAIRRAEGWKAGLVTEGVPSS